MKNGNWMPIDTRLAVFLPKDRPYTELEAMYSLQLNYDRGATVTVAGLAASWQWKRHTVYALLEKVGALVVYQGKKKSRSTGGVIVPVKGACQAHVGDMSCACRAHVRLIKNNKLDNKRCISIPSQPHDNNMWATLLSIPHTTYSYKDKEGGKNDNMEYVGIGSINSSVFSLNYKSLKLGYWENNDTGTKESDGQSAEISRSGNNNGNNSVDLLPCNGINFNWSDLNGQPGQLSQTTLGISGQGHNGDISVGNNGSSLGDSQAIIGLGSQEAMGTQSTPMDRKTNEQKVIINDGMKGQSEDALEPPQEGAKAKKGKPKNGIKLDLSVLDAGFDPSVVEEFISYRKIIKKSALTQRALIGVCRNAKKTSETHGGSFSDALVYAMENNWLTPDPKYIDDNKPRYTAFLDDQHGPRSSDKEKEKKIADLRRRAQIAQEKWDREHGAADA